MITKNVTVTLVSVDCYKCHAIFGMTAEADSAYRKNHVLFCCPYCGERQHYVIESEEERLRKKVNTLEQNYKWADNARRSAEQDAANERRSKAAYKGQLTKVRRKVANGSCPCCNRHFENLRRHMLTKHPEYVVESNGGDVEE